MHVCDWLWDYKICILLILWFHFLQLCDSTLYVSYIGHKGSLRVLEEKRGFDCAMHWIDTFALAGPVVNWWSCSVASVVHLLDLSDIGWICIAMAGSVLHWLDISCIGWICLALARSVLHWLDLSCIGWICLAIGWICLALAGSVLHWLDLSCIG